MCVIKAYEASSQWGLPKCVPERREVRDQETYYFLTSCNFNERLLGGNNYWHFSLSHHSVWDTMKQNKQLKWASYLCLGHTILLNYASIFYIQFEWSKDVMWLWNNMSHAIKIIFSEGTLYRMEWLLVRPNRGWQMV